MRNKQQGYTLTELLIAIVGLGTIAFVLFLICAVVYAVAKYLFGWL